MKSAIAKTACTLLFLVGGVLCRSEDRNWEEANVLLAKASALEAFPPGDPPKQNVRVDFTFRHTSQGNVKGTFIRDFVRPEYWSDHLTLGDFRQDRVRIEKKMWTAKNADFVPLQADLLFTAFFTTSFRMTDSDSVERVHNRKVEDVEARCVEFHEVRGRTSTPGEICVESQRGMVVYWKYGTREIWYSQYVPFANAMRPSHLVVGENRAIVVEADVSYVAAPELKSESFVPLKNGEVTDVCSTSRPSTAKSAPEPFFPRSLSRGQYPGVVMVKAEVDENGRVVKDAVVTPVHPMIDGAALEAVKSWVYEPRLCDGKPVRTTVGIEVHFR